MFSQGFDGSTMDSMDIPAKVEPQIGPRPWRVPLATLIVAFCVSPCAVVAVNAEKAWDKQPWQGLVTHVTDGDTLWVRPKAGPQGKPAAVKVRLDGIDAPESCQDYGRSAQAALSRQLLRQTVRVEPRRYDSFGRLLAKISLEKPLHPIPDVGAWMVEHGHAWSQRFKQDPGPYAALEKRARTQQRGLFAQLDAQRPREFRLEHGSCQP